MGRHGIPSPALRYWNMARQRYCRRLARYRNTRSVSADPVAKPAAHTRAESRGSGPSKVDAGERQTLCWREMDSNLRSLLRGSVISAASMSFVGLGLKTVAHWARDDSSSPFPSSGVPRDAGRGLKTTGWRHTMSKVRKGMVKGSSPGCAATTELRRFRPFARLRSNREIRSTTGVQDHGQNAVPTCRDRRAAPDRQRLGSDACLREQPDRFRAHTRSRKIPELPLHAALQGPA